MEILELLAAVFLADDAKAFIPEFQRIDQAVEVLARLNQHCAAFFRGDTVEIVTGGRGQLLRDGAQPVSRVQPLRRAVGFGDVHIDHLNRAIRRQNRRRRKNRKTKCKTTQRGCSAKDLVIHIRHGTSHSFRCLISLSIGFIVAQCCF